MHRCLCSRSSVSLWCNFDLCRMQANNPTNIVANKADTWYLHHLAMVLMKWQLGTIVHHYRSVCDNVLNASFLIFEELSYDTAMGSFSYHRFVKIIAWSKIVSKPIFQLLIPQVRQCQISKLADGVQQVTYTCACHLHRKNPDSKVHGTNMGPIWGRQDPGGPHVCQMNFAIWKGIVTFAVGPTKTMELMILRVQVKCAQSAEMRLAVSGPQPLFTLGLLVFALSLVDFLSLLLSPSTDIKIFCFCQKYHLKDTYKIFKKIMLV